MVKKKTIHEIREMVWDSKLFDVMRDKDMYKEYKKLCFSGKITGPKDAVMSFNRRFYNLETLQQQTAISWYRASQSEGYYWLVNRARESKRQLKIICDEIAIGIGEDLKSPTSDKLLKQEIKNYFVMGHFGPGCDVREIVTDKILGYGRFIRLDEDTPECSLMKDFGFIGRRWGSSKEINLEVNNEFGGCSFNGGWFNFLEKGFELYSRLEKDGFCEHPCYASGGITVDEWIRDRFSK